MGKVSIFGMGTSVFFFVFLPFFGRVGNSRLSIYFRCLSQVFIRSMHVVSETIGILVRMGGHPSIVRVIDIWADVGNCVAA